ncbi:MAG: class I SAM-dependent methyltransferase [Candidatus Micrarchaeia archaeon]
MKARKLLRIGNKWRKCFFGNCEFFVFDDVYEPAEDSFMLARSVQNVKGKLLDMGTGCGIVAISTKAHAVGVDISSIAVENARFNARINGKKCSFFVSDLFENVGASFDCIAFNPPYLPTGEEDVVSGPIDLAWNGGADGRKVIDRFIEEFPDYLNEGGCLYMVSSSLCDNEKTIRMLGKRGFACSIEDRFRAFFEEIVVIKAVRE